MLYLGMVLGLIGFVCMLIGVFGTPMRHNLILIGGIGVVLGMVLFIEIAVNQAVEQHKNESICKSKGGEWKQVGNTILCLKPNSVITW